MPPPVQDPAVLLLDRGLLAILERILLLLVGPRDLKVCRQVCRLWSDFIKEKLWGSRAVRRRLEARLAARWREGGGRRPRQLPPHRPSTLPRYKCSCG